MRRYAVDAVSGESYNVVEIEDGGFVLADDALAEIAKLRAEKAEIIRKAWYASSAWTLGGMRGFVQRHPDLQEYLKQELGEHETMG